MTPTDAARLLSIEPTATPEQIEAKFLEMRSKLEDRIAKAPTPGLKEKYRASLTEITTAFETLALAADASSLPVLQREPATASPRPEGAPPTPAPAAAREAGPTAGPAAAPARPAPASRSSREFAIVALLAVIVLGAGGWWVMKTRTEKAEQARIAAAEAQRQQAEAERRTALATELRTALAEAGVTWEVHESELRDAERRASDTKSELRGFRDGPAARAAELSARAKQSELYASWLKHYLLRHPAKVARARAEQLLAAGSIEEAVAAGEELSTALAAIDDEIAARRTDLLNATTSVAIESMPAGIRFVFTDTYGRTFEGKTPAEFSDVPLTHVPDPLPGEPGPIQLGELTRGKMDVRFIRPGWKDQVIEAVCASPTVQRLRAEFVQGTLVVESKPEGVPFRATNANGWSVTGKTPARFADAPPGRVDVTLSRPGYADVRGFANVTTTGVAILSLDQRPQHVRIAVAEPEAEIWVDGKFIGRKAVTLTDHAPGQHQLELRHPQWARYRATIDIKQEFTRREYAYSYAELTKANVTCASCQGKGSHTKQSRCTHCRGTGRERCSSCEGRGYRNWDMLGQLTCTYCKGTGRSECLTCSGEGKLYDYPLCNTCRGLGLVSRLQLNQ